MNIIEEFIEYCENQVKCHSIYVSGGQGQGACRNIPITEKWIRRMEKDDKNYERAVAFWQKQVKSGYGDKLSAFDCSGLVCYFYQNLKKILKYDHTANGLWGKCEQTSQRKPGYLVFRITNGRAVHVGVIVKDDYVIHSKGRDVGVVKQKYSSKYWHKIGRPKFVPQELFDNQSSSDSQSSSDNTNTSNSDKYVFTRNLKQGRRGEDVVQLKKLLIAAGYDDGITIDKPSSESFGPKTKKLIKKYQKDKGLKVDGVAGHETIGALGGIYT